MSLSLSKIKDNSVKKVNLFLAASRGELNVCKVRRTHSAHTHKLQVSMPVFMSESLTFPRHLMTFVDMCKSKLMDLRVYRKWKENSDGQMSTGSGHLLWLQH